MDETNLLDVFRHRLGVPDLSPLREEARLRQKAFDEVVKAYNEWDAPVAPPPKAVGELRPVFAPSALSPRYEVVHTLQSLLVAHSVAIVVPDSVNYIGRLVWLLTLLEDAIDEGVVHVLSERTVGTSPKFFNQWMADIAPLPASLGEDERTAQLLQLIEAGDIAIVLDACANSPDSFDLTCRTPAQREWLRERVEELPRTASTSQDAHAYLSDLLAFDLPVVGLGTRDLLALRKEGMFDAWRQALAETIREVAAMDDDAFLSPASGRLALLCERMAAAAENITGQSQSWPRRVAGETASFGIACAGGAVGAVVGGPVGAAAVGGGAFLTTRVIDWLHARPSAADKTARRMVVDLFAPGQ